MAKTKIHYRANFTGRKRWRIGRIGQRLTPGFGSCLRCETPWSFVQGHVTNYAAGRGCFPVCEQCWQELENGEARLPYYVALWHQWERDCRSMEEADQLTAEWPLIEAAVLAEQSDG